MNSTLVSASLFAAQRGELDLAVEENAEGLSGLSQRLHGYLQDRPPAEFEKLFYAETTSPNQLVETQVKHL
ncbi:hypothetical protein [Nesterenkonia aerolata]|uniref:Uncharacterized protein n=1 Tax=Nesterenkonia aerolata TaxID=3074079 RepID=A0ABU2DTN6_9MICC|nr:hypothetical protein [Nesterenkonia sp. LY-0111]MDR8019645.1 hypothetical protein [Nesterenkonia sp. LY-0111]